MYGKDYPVTFIVMFVVALLSSALTTRLKDHARQSAKLAYRTKVLFDTNQLLQKAETDKAILNTLISQIQKLLGKHIIIYPVQHGTLGTPILSPDSASAEKSEFLTCPGNGRLPCGFCLTINGRCLYRHLSGCSVPLSGHPGTECCLWSCRHGSR